MNIFSDTVAAPESTTIIMFIILLLLLLLLMRVYQQPYSVRPCHHGAARPEVAMEASPSNMEGSC
jgi:hypothetical protein